MFVSIEDIDLDRMGKDTKFHIEVIRNAFQHSGDELDQQIKDRFGSRNYWQAMEMYERIYLQLTALEKMAAIRYLAVTHFRLETQVLDRTTRPAKFTAR